MTPDEETEAAHFELWEDELPPIHMGGVVRGFPESEEAGEVVALVFEIDELPRKRPGFLSELLGWLLLLLVVSLPWVAIGLLVRLIRSLL